MKFNDKIRNNKTKLYKCLLVMILVVLPSIIHAQNQTVTLSNQLTLRDAFLEIEKQTKLSVDYSAEAINVNNRIGKAYRNTKVSVVMSEILKDTGFTFSIEGTHILIIPVPAVTNIRTITGVVTDERDEPVIGANVLEKESKNGAITDINGEFTITVTEASTLQVSYIGCSPQEIRVGSRSNIHVKLIEDTRVLDEVVVVGYGVQRKVNLTGSIGTIKVDEALKGRPVTNIQELLASSVPGLVITKSSGEVGSGGTINIRGTSTIGSGAQVLVLIDGVPGNMHTLNPNDIESISVLKDAASAAIYGSRAANGVILVTTKMAKSYDRPAVEVSSSIGIQNPQFKLDFVGSEEYMRLYDQALMNDGKDAYFGEQGIKDLKAGKYPDNKWYKEIYKKNTLINNTHVALSGAEKSITYRVSVSNDYQEGSLPNDNYNRLIFKPDLLFNLLSNLKARVNLQYTQTNIKRPNGGTTYWQSQASRISPITPIREANGLYGVGSSMAGNPIAGVNESGYNKQRYKEMLAIFEATFSPLKDWNIKGNVSAYTYNMMTKNRVDAYYLYDADGEIAKTENIVNTLKETNEYNYRTLIQFISDYKFTLAGKHNFTVLGGYSQEYFKTDNFWASRDKLPFDGIDVLDTGSSNPQNGGNAKDYAMQSYFGRFTYDFDGKYLFEANIRADGSSRFAKGHRWGVFPSFSAGWNLHRERFMKSQSWLSELKIRGSWGSLGDADKISDYYPTAEVLAYNPKIYSFNNTLVGGAFNNVAINRSLSWEKSTLTNIGLDFGIFDQRIKFTVDYFNNVRSDILYRPPVPSEFGLSAPWSNLLKMKNQGIEFFVAYNDNSGDFRWGIDMNASLTKNKVLEMGDSDKWIEGNTITYLNDRYQLAYGYEAEGFFQSQEDIDNHARQGNVMPGNIKFKNQNDDDVIDGNDRVVLNRKVPVNYGININLGYKGFDFSMNMYGRLNVMKYMSGYEGWAFYLSQNARPIHLDSWSETNTDASYPRLTLTNTSNDTQYNSYWLRNANYLKLQNMQLGYTLPKALIEKVNIQYLRLFISGQNLATITGYDGFDPEGGWYPLARTFAFGFNLKF